MLGEGEGAGALERRRGWMPECRQSWLGGREAAHVCERDNDVSISFWIGHVALAR